MTKVLLYCCDKIGKAMAGPAIRYWELAKALSADHEVTLYTPYEADIPAEGFTLIANTPLSLSGQQVMVTQVIGGKIAVAAKRHGVKLILDAYAPEPLEHLEVFRFDSSSKRALQGKKTVNALSFALKMADGVICANTHQKDLWTGFILALHRLTPDLYDRDSSLKNFIDIVPFGLSSEPPSKGQGNLRRMFHLAEEDFVLAWGGGIWNWFDPLTLIYAIKEVSIQHPQVRLVFMGTRHPNDKVPQMKMASDAYELAKNLGLLDKHIFFNSAWIPYQERGSYLLDADVGVSTHFDYLETRFAFRTRILDYLWSGLPILATEGDCFAELINKEEIGITVPFQDPSALAQAISTLVTNAPLRKKLSSNSAAIRPQFFWEQTAKPLNEMICRLSAPNKPSLYRAFKAGTDFCKLYGIKNLVKLKCQSIFS